MSIKLQTILTGGLLACVAALLSGCAQYAQPGPAKSTTCAPNCEIKVIMRPGLERPDIPPGQFRLRAAPGDTVTFRKVPRGGPEVTLLFNEAAFVDENGKEVFLLRLVEDETNLTVKSVPCIHPTGCKYTVFDANEPRRPPLDPWIIIDPF